MANKPALLQRQTSEQAWQNLEANFYSFPDSARPLWQQRLRLQSDKEALSYYAHTVTGGVRAMLRSPVFQRLSEIDLPVLIIYGEEDRFIPNPYLRPMERTQDVAVRGQRAMAECQAADDPQSRALRAMGGRCGRE